MKVILKRGPKPDLEFGPESSKRAWQRVESLAWLHCAKFYQIDNDTIVVDASSYYND